MSESPEPPVVCPTSHRRGTLCPPTHGGLCTAGTSARAAEPWRRGTEAGAAAWTAAVPRYRHDRDGPLSARWGADGVAVGVRRRFPLDGLSACTPAGPDGSTHLDDHGEAVPTARRRKARAALRATGRRTIGSVAWDTDYLVIQSPRLLRVVRPRWLRPRRRLWSVRRVRADALTRRTDSLRARRKRRTAYQKASLLEHRPHGHLRRGHSLGGSKSPDGAERAGVRDCRPGRLCAELGPEGGPTSTWAWKEIGLVVEIDVGAPRPRRHPVDDAPPLQNEVHPQRRHGAAHPGTRPRLTPDRLFMAEVRARAHRLLEHTGDVTRRTGRGRMLFLHRDHRLRRGPGCRRLATVRPARTPLASSRRPGHQSGRSPSTTVQRPWWAAAPGRGGVRRDVRGDPQHPAGHEPRGERSRVCCCTKRRLACLFFGQGRGRTGAPRQRPAAPPGRRGTASRRRGAPTGW